MSIEARLNATRLGAAECNRKVLAPAVSECDELDLLIMEHALIEGALTALTVVAAPTEYFAASPCNYR